MTAGIAYAFLNGDSTTTSRDTKQKVSDTEKRKLGRSKGSTKSGSRTTVISDNEDDEIDASKLRGAALQKYLLFLFIMTLVLTLSQAINKQKLGRRQPTLIESSVRKIKHCWVILPRRELTWGHQLPLVVRHVYQAPCLLPAVLVHGIRLVLGRKETSHSGPHLGSQNFSPP